MIKYLKYFQCIILFHIVLSSLLLSQIVKKSDNLIYSSKTGNLYTGKVFELYKDGTKYFEGYYKDGLMNGSWTYYYTNAVIKAKGNFFHGDGGNCHKVSKIPQFKKNIKNISNLLPQVFSFIKNIAPLRQ